MSRALIKYVRVSSTKARLIAKEVQGMNAELALASLEFMPNKAAGIISKAIASAVANGDFEPQEVEVVSCRVDRASYLKRWTPRARGTATRILKPTSHILVEVAPAGKNEKSTEKKAVAPQAKVEQKAEVKPEVKKEAKPAAQTKTAAKKGDDLTKLVGVGKAYQEKLNSEGIYTFADVANMSEEQIATMEEKYSFKGNFKDTIEDAKSFVNGKGA